MTRPVNPYIAGAPLRGEGGFFGRQDTLEWARHELLNPATNALVLFGQRRIGKTTLLLQLQRTLPTDICLPVYFDLQDQATRPLGQVLADLADTVAEKAGLDTPNLTAFDDRGDIFRRKFLPQLYSLTDSRRPVFLLDEFDVMDQVAEAELPESAAAKALFPFLRRLMTEDPYPAFVFVVGRRAEDLSIDFTQTFKASLVREIWVLDRAGTEAVVRQAETNGTLRFTARAVTRIFNLTSGHPYLIQLLCQRIWEQAYVSAPSTPPRIDVAEVETAIPDTLEVGTQALIWLWNGLSPAEKIYAAALAETSSEKETIYEDLIIQVLTAHATRLRTREVELAPRDLVKRRVLKEAGKRQYQFAVELLRRWVYRHKPLQEVKDELDQVDPLAEQVFRVGQGYFQRRKWEGALRYFREALEANPHHFRARLNLGEALLELGDTAQAVIELEQAYELDKTEARLSLARGLIAHAKARLRAGDEDGTLAACTRTLEVSPSEREAQEIRSDIWTQRGDAALKQDDLRAALAAYAQATNVKRIAEVESYQRQRLFTILVNRAHALAQAEAARERQALLALITQAQAHAQAQRWAEAVTASEQLLAQTSDKLIQAEWQIKLSRFREEAALTGRFTEGRSALERGDLDQAQRAFADVINARPDYTQGNDVAADLLYQAILRARATQSTSLDREIQVAQGRDETIQLWQAAGEKALNILKGHESRVRSVTFSPDGSILASGADDGTIRLWQVSDGKLRCTLEGHMGSVSTVAFSLDGLILVSGATDRTIRLWQISDGALLDVLERSLASVNSVAFSPDSSILASGADDRAVELWQISKRKMRQALEGHADRVFSVAFSPDGRILAAGGRDKTIRLWRVSSGVLLHTLEGHRDWVRSVAFSPDGGILASGADDRTVRLWRVLDGTLLRTLEEHKDWVKSVAFSPDGATLASGAGDKVIRLWRISDGTLLRTLKGHTGGVTAVAFSKDEALLASGSLDGTVRLWGAPGV